METDVATRSESDAERIPAPGALAVLQSCSRIERRAVRSMAIHLHVDRGQVVCEAGDFGDELFVLLEGAVVVETRGEALRRLGAGDGFGEMAPLARTPRRSTVTALAPTELLVFRRREFALLLDRAPRVGRALLRAASTRLRACPDHALEVRA
jgi:CRP-like cAMP-binding protein